MKKFFALCFMALIACTALASTGWAGYDASEYQVEPYTNYLTNCYGFVNAVLAKEQNVSLPAYDTTMRYYPNNDNYLVGGKLLNSEGYTATTFENIKALFDNAEVGDVVQMYWDTGATYSSQHTVIVSATNKANNKVSFLHSNWWPHFTYAEIVNTEFPYSTIAGCCTKAIDKPFHDGTYKYGGISLYRFSGSVTPLPEGSVRIDAENFPDEYFRNYVLENCDPNKDGILSAEEAASVTHIGVDYRDVTDLKGIEYFTALVWLSCPGNQLTSLDVSKNTALTHLDCANNQLTTINVSKNTALIDLDCHQNQLTSLDVSNNTALTELWCYGNQLTELDVSKNTALTWLLCYENQLTTLNMSSNIALTHLDCANNQLTTINVSNNTVLTYLDCDNNQLTVLDVSNNIALEVLNCAYNKLTTLDVSNCQNLSDEHIRYDSGLKILRNKPRLVSSLINVATNTPVSLYIPHSSVISSIAQLIEAVVKSGIITDTGTKETLQKVAKCLQIISSIDSRASLKQFLTDILIPSIFKSPVDKGDKGYGEKFQLSESLSLNVTPGVFKTSEGTVKITLASSLDLSNDVYCMIASGDSGIFFKVPASGGSRRVFTAEFNAGELFAGMDAGMIDIMCVSCVSDDEGIRGMLMSNTAVVDWLKKDNTPPGNLPDTLGIAITGQPYTLQLTATGGDTIIWTRTGSFPTGLTLNSDGLISGTPKKAGNFTFTVTAKNKYGTYSKKYTVKVIDPVSITTASLKAGTIDKSYTVTMMAKGTKPITWNAEGLPAGLTMNAKTGKISGKPTVYGDFSVKITASNEAGSVTRTLALTVKAVAPTLSGSLKQSTLNVAYSSGLTVKGTAPITWSISGELPDGLTFDTSTGVISGTPKEYGKNGNFKITITASNPGGSKSKSVTFKVKATAPILSGSLKQSTFNVAYSSGLNVKGSDPITWSIDGTLPDGLTFDTSTGIISGTPKEYGKNGSFKIKITASNPAGSRSKSITFKVKATAPTLSGSLKQSTLNVAYSSGLNVKGTEPIEWSISGALPDGLTFDTSTGVISGTPKEYGKNGSFKIKITASNIAGSRSKSITFRVKGTKPTIKAKFPNATAGEYYSVNLTATGSDPITWTADLPEYLTLNGNTIAGNIPDTVPGNKIKIKVYASNPVKTVNNTYTIKVITNKKAIHENLNDDNDTGSTENESDNAIPTDNNAGEVQGVTGVTGDSTQTENQKSGIPESYIVVAELGEISRDVAGMYDFEVELPDSVSAGSELIYIANSETPSDDDKIAEFFDDTGKEITTVPESRKITLSVWLNKGVVYSPALAVKK